MKHIVRTLAAVAAGLLLLSQSSEASETADVSLSKEVDRYLERAQPEGAAPDTLRVFWKKGIKMETADGNFKLSIFGRLMFDSLWWSSSDLTAIRNLIDDPTPSAFISDLATSYYAAAETNLRPVVQQAQCHHLHTLFQRVFHRPARPPGSLLVVAQHRPLVEAGTVDQVLLDDLVDALLQHLEELPPPVDAVLLEPEPVEPVLEQKLEDVRVALLVIPERLDVER